MKAIANTTIRLGLLNLPVGVCKATGELEDVKLNLGDAQGRRLSQQYVDPDGNAVAREDQTRTFEGHLIDQEALEQIAEATKLPDLTILKIEGRSRLVMEAHRITGFYYLQSQKKNGNINAYKLFADALREMDGVAVTKFTFRSRQHLMIIWPDAEGVLCASTLAYAGDMRSPDENVTAHLDAAYTEQEMAAAKMLLSAMSDNDSDPLSTETDDAVSMRHDLVQKALAGEPLALPAAPSQPEANTALADALAASLAAVKAGA